MILNGNKKNQEMCALQRMPVAFSCIQLNGRVH